MDLDTMLVHRNNLANMLIDLAQRRVKLRNLAVVAGSLPHAMALVDANIAALRWALQLADAAIAAADAPTPRPVPEPPLPRGPGWKGGA